MLLATTFAAAAAATIAGSGLLQDTVPADTVVRLERYVVKTARATSANKMEAVTAISLTLPTLSRRASSVIAVDLLRDVSGVHVQQTSAGQGAVVLRGLVGNQVLILVNGVPMNNGTYRDGPGQYFATIDPETIERIEVVRGPASVLYGSDAQGGVINIVTRPHDQAGQRSVRATLNASTADMGYRGRFSAGLSQGRWDIAVGGTLISAGDLRAGGGLGRQTPSEFDAGGLDAAVQYRAGERHTFSGAVQHFRMVDVPRYDRYVTFRAPDQGRDVEHIFDPQTRQLGYARYVYTPGGHAITRLEVTASLSIQREGRRRIKRLTTGPDSMRTSWRDDVYTPGISIVGMSTPAVGRSVVSLTWGTELYHDRLNSSGFMENLDTGTQTPIMRETATDSIASGSFPDGANANRFGAFLAAEIPLLRSLTLSLGGRWSTFRNEANVGTEFGGRVQNTSSDITGQAGLVAAPAESWHVAVRIAEGFRAPNLYDLTRVGPVPGGIALPNPAARPERSVSREISVRYGSASTAFDVTAYYTSIDDFIDRSPSTFNGDTLFNGERVFQGVNVGKARVWGIEAEAGRQVGSVELRTNLFFTHGEQTLASGIEEPMSKIPPLTGTASARWQPYARPFWLEYILRWSAPQKRLGSRDLTDPRIPAGGTAGYTVHGVRAGTSLGRTLEVSAGFENIADKLYRTHASGVDNAARHVWVGLSWLGRL